MDVFDEGIGDDILPEDWAKVERSRKTDGYKEGIAAGQESCLQEGFNSGFSQGTTTTFSHSFLKGIINAIITSLHPKDQGLKDAVATETIKDLEAILSILDSLQMKMRSKKRCSSSGETSCLSKDAQEKTEGCENDGKTTCSVDSETSHDNPSSSSSACKFHHNRDNVAGGETTSAIQENASGSTEDEHLFYSHDPELKKIVERLKPHLVQNNCQDILCVSHQLLKV